jgi:hypothetical protein
MKSPCCGARVVVPVDVTAHLIVNRDGTISDRLSDTMRGFRWAAQQVGAEINEAYCEGCGESVDASEPNLILRYFGKQKRERRS